VKKLLLVFGFLLGFSEAGIADPLTAPSLWQTSGALNLESLRWARMEAFMARSRITLPGFSAKVFPIQ
jgi:hypothetical protein